jgi:hypothetical protein
MARRKQVDPKEKAKRQKVMIAVGGVLLLGLLAFQVPRTMKMLHQQGVGNDTSSSSASTTPVSGTGAPLAPPNLDGGGSGSGGSGAASTPDGLSDPSTSLAAAPGQLVTFDRFRTKDPFFQQLGGGSSSSASGSGSGSASASQQSLQNHPQRSSGNGTGDGSIPSPNPGPPPPPPPGPKLTSATISVNGVSETVLVAKTFPAADPVFVLVSVSKGSAKIGIAGGSYENGAATVTLKKGHPLTLMNTADSTQYVLKLLATA